MAVGMDVGFVYPKRGPGRAGGREVPSMYGEQKGQVVKGRRGGGPGAIKAKGKGGQNAHVTDLHRLLLFNW